MKKLSTVVNSVLIAAAAVAAPTANEDFVVSEDAKTFTNAVNAAKVYTDSVVSNLPPSGVDAATVTNIVRDVAPLPGNYAAVSNAAMNAAQRSDLAAATNALDRAIVGGEIIPLEAVVARYASSAGTAYGLGADGNLRTPEDIFAQLDAATATNAAQTAALDGKASIADATLSPVYSDTPTYGEWVCNPEGAVNPGSLEYELYSVVREDGAWVLYLGNDIDPATFIASETDDEIVFNDATGGYKTTATRTRTDIVGYTLGTQTNKVLSSTNAVAAARAVADAATVTNAQQTAALAAVAQSSTNYTATAIASADTSYRRFTGLTNLNQSVQFVTLSASDTTLSIELPITGETKDWIVYVLAVTNTTLVLPPATWYMADTANTNAIPAGMTAFYFSQMATGIYLLGRQELEPVTIQGN